MYCRLSDLSVYQVRDILFECVVASLYMTETFVHVDRLDKLEAGDVLDLDWSMQLTNESAITAQNEAVLRDLYPEGLSRHGVRYASTMVGPDQNVTTPGKSEPLVAFLDTVDPETEGVFSKPTNALYEWFVELVRLAEFSECQSRFQSFFAWDSQDQIRDLPQVDDQRQQLVEVRCNAYTRRDMSLVSSASFSQGLANARRYWRGAAGDDPVWEIVMEPPVEVIETI